MPTPAEQAAEEALIKHALARGYLSPANLEHARSQRAQAPGTPFLALLAGALPPAALPELREIYTQQLSGSGAPRPAPSPPPRKPPAVPVDEGASPAERLARAAAATRPLVSVDPAPAPGDSGDEDAPALAASGPHVGLPTLVGVAAAVAVVFGLLGAVTALALSGDEPGSPASPASPVAQGPARDALIRLLGNEDGAPLPDPHVLLARLRGRPDGELLRELAASDLPGVRQNAAALLGLLGRAESKPVLAALAEDPDPLMALVASHSLRLLSEDPPTRGLIAALKSERDDVRQFAIGALAHVGGPSTLLALRPLAKSHPDPATRARAVRALLTLDPGSLESLRPEPRVVTRVVEREPGEDPSSAPQVSLAPPEPAPPPASDPSPEVTPEPAPPAEPVAKPVPKPAAEPKAAHAVAAVRALLNEEQFGAALERAKTALARFGEHAELTRLRGRAELGLGELEQAEASFKKALDLAPDLTRAYFDLCLAFAGRGKKKNAHASLGMALRLGFRDKTALRTDPLFAKVKEGKPFKALLARFFNSTEVAESDAAQRLKFSSRQLKAVFKQQADPHLRALEVVRFPEAGSLEATRFLCGLLKDKAAIVRMAVSELVGQASDPASQRYLCEQASSKLPARQKLALLRALGSLKTPEAFLPLLTALSDKDAAVRLEAARAIGDHPDARAVDPLIALLADAKPREGVVINEALGKITGQDLGLSAQDWTNWWTAHRGTEIGPVRNPCGELKAPVTVATPSGFSDRLGKSKKRALRKNGGSKQTEAAVLAALDWLARHQNKDGRWDTDSWAMRCAEKQAWERVTKVRKRKWDVRNTGLALMAFLGAGHSHMQGEHSRQVRRGLEFLKRAQRPNGHFAGDHNHHGYSHAAATIAVTEAYLLTRDCHYKVVAEDALAWIVRRQHQNGGWGWTAEESYTTLTAWNLVALNAGYQAGLDVPAATIVSVRFFLDQLTHGPESKTPGFADQHLRPNSVVGEGLSAVDYQDVHSGGTPLSTTLGLWCRLFTGQGPGDPRVAGALAQLAKALPAPNKAGKVRSTERVFFGSQAALLSGGKLWGAWNQALQKTLLEGQEKTGCERGTWEPVNDHGRIYSTALGALSLESYYRLSRPVE